MVLYYHFICFLVKNMVNRYGRHGNEAWLHLQRRRSMHQNHAVVPFDRMVVHIHLHLPNEERIFIVTTDGDKTRLPATQGTIEVEGTTETFPANNSSDHDIRRDWSVWEQDAYNKAMKRFGSDFHQQSWPTVENLAKGAKGEAYSLFPEYFPNLRSPEERSKLLNRYVKVYVSTYNGLYEEEVQNGILPDRSTLLIQERAIHDKQHLQLIGHQPIIIGTLAAASIISSDELDLTKPDTLPRLDQLVQVYRQAYTTGKEVVRGYYASEPFPGIL